MQQYTVISDSLKNKVGMLLFNCLYSLMLRSSKEDIINQLKCKNKNLRRLISQKPVNRDNYNIAVFNLSSYKLDVSGLKQGLHRRFTDKSRHIKQNLAVKFEALSSKLDLFIKEDSKENFYEYLKSVTNIASNNGYRDKDNTFKLLNRLSKNENIVVLLADKQSCMVILNKTDYVNKVNAIINEGISKGKYVETVDSTHKDFQHFQDFLYRHFYKTKCYDGMRPVSNQPARFFANSKTHKFNTIEDIYVKDLKLRPIIDQTGTYIYDALKVVAQFLKPLARNELTIILAFAELLKNIENKDDVESLFTSIPIKVTIDYTSYIRYIPKKLLNQCVRNRFFRSC